MLLTPKGMDTIVIQMCATEAVGGYLAAGSYVAVYATVPTNLKVNRDSGRAASTTLRCRLVTLNTTLVLPKVKVLSVSLGPGAQSQASSGSTSVLADPASSPLSQGAVAVTFAVHPDEVDKLITDVQVEMPYLALLPPKS